MEDLTNAYDAIAEDWHKEHRVDDWWREATNHFVSLLKKGDLVLDAGCGGGTKSKYLIEHGLNVFGIDASAKMIDICRREVPAANFAVHDMRNADSLDQKFDGIFAQASLLHIPKKEISKTIKNLAENLKTGGYFYASVKEVKVPGREEEIVVEDNYGYPYKRFFSHYTLGDFKKYFTDNNLKIIYESVSSNGRTNWIQIVAEK